MKVRSASRSGHEVDTTTGPIALRLLQYCVPLILSGILSLLYNAADMVVVGRFSGSTALAAVSSTGSLINLLVNLFLGLSVGTSVAVAHAWGAKDHDQIRAAVHTGIALSLIGGVLLGVVGFFAARPLLRLMGSPEDVIDLASLYLKIYFVGMPVNMLYIFGSAILRAVGDTKRPMYYLAASGLLNLLLNLLLVIVFKMSVAGVALATIASQAMVAVLVMRCLLRADEPLRFHFSMLHIDRLQLMRTARIGLPAGLQSTLFSLANTIVQSSVNSFGSAVMAGNGASASLEGFVYIAMNSVHQGAQTFTSQNVGAGKFSRVRRITWTSQLVVIAVGIVTGAIVLPLGRPLLQLYTTDPAAIDVGITRMTVIVSSYFLCGMMDTMVGSLRGIGYSVIPMVVTLACGCGLRILWIMTVFAQTRSLTMLYLSYPVTWTVSFTILLLCYFTMALKKLPREDLAPPETR